MPTKTVEHPFGAVNTEPRVAKFRITPTHPDFIIAQGQSSEARRLGNSLNYVARKVYDQRAYNREFNKTVTDKRKRIRNTHTKIDRLFQDPELIAMGVVPWLKKNKGCMFTHKHNFGGLIKPVSVWLGLQLPTKVAQLVGVKLSEAWKSYHELMIRFYEDPKLNQKPCPPGYKKQFGYVEYNKQAINGGQAKKIKQVKITRVVPSGWTVGFNLPDGLTLADVRSARLTPLHATAFELEVIYDVEVKVPQYPDLDTALAKAGMTGADKAAKKVPLTVYTDLGVDVLGAFVFSDGRTPLLVNGKPLKAINAHANKQNTKIRTVHDIERRNIFAKQMKQAYHDEVDMPVYPSTVSSKKLDRLWQTRNDHVNNYLHTASSRVIKMLVNTGVKVLVIGWSPGFKDSVNLGKVNNQKFAMIPHARWRDQLIYKGSAAGILVITKEESYTSKASFLDQDFIPTWGTGDRQGWKPSGKRIKRGMYESAEGYLIHADVNGAYNGLAKHVVRLNPKRVVTDKGVVVHPVWLEMPGLNHRPAKPDLQTLENCVSTL